MLLTVAAQKSLDIVDMALNSTGMVFLDLLVLVSFSILTWYIIFYKTYYYWRIKQANRQFLDVFWSGKTLDEIKNVAETTGRGNLGAVFIAGWHELAKLKQRQVDGAAGSLSDVQNLERALKRSAMQEITRLESLLPVLATVAATAPFLGLFGTVWGIMESFTEIGMQGNTTLATVAPGIVDALVTTALGLMAAIPAVIAYNYFLRQVRLVVADMETFANDFLNIAQRRWL